MSLRKSTRPIILTLLAALLITSCNVGATPAPTVDVNALGTAIVQTTVAQLAVQSTQTSQAAPTNTLAATNTSAAPTLALPTLDTSGVASPTLDVSALPTFSFESTAAASNTPAAGLPTAVSLPTSQGQATAALGDACDNMQFLYDVTISDGTLVNGGETFTKIWAVKNTGSCLWDDGYSLLVVGKDPAVGANNFLFTENRPQDFVPGGSETQLGASVTAPCAPGSYSATWRMQNDRGFYFGTYLSVYFQVGTTQVGGC